MTILGSIRRIFSRPPQRVATPQVIRARYDGARYGYRSPEARDLLETYVRSRSEGFGEETKRQSIEAIGRLWYSGFSRDVVSGRRGIGDPGESRSRTR